LREVHLLVAPLHSWRDRVGYLSDLWFSSYGRTREALKDLVIAIKDAAELIDCTLICAGTDTGSRIAESFRRLREGRVELVTRYYRLELK
jgi:hypothetical protein